MMKKVLFSVKLPWTKGLMEYSRIYSDLRHLTADEIWTLVSSIQLRSV